MSPHNPAQYARSAADALDRLVRDVRAGRAEWGHPHNVRQAADDLTRAADAMATALQQMAAALDPHDPSTQRSATALHLAGQAATTAATNLRNARRSLH
ncbi:hypothetical protein AB0N09_35980 [Streptomyces erythrochromogenes]|uniref:hypothetical protein n=1 Tax=Streptomyces TaxID=1883 RepID=UPI00343D778C